MNKKNKTLKEDDASLLAKKNKLKVKKNNIITNLFTLKGTFSKRNLFINKSKYNKDLPV